VVVSGVEISPVDAGAADYYWGYMKTLVMHIGAHKTGTTVLQNHVFPHFEGYLGKFENQETESREGCLPQGAPALAEQRWLEVYRRWALGSPKISVAARRWIESLLTMPQSTFLVSSEEFHSWPSEGDRVGNFLSDSWLKSPKQSPHPVTQLLTEIKEASAGRLVVRVILSIRNQVDYIGSRYAQQSINLRFPCQEDFELRLGKLLSQPDSYLDWSQQVEDLAREVGSENLLLLLYEDGLEANVLLIEDFLEWAPAEPFTSLPRLNVKRIEAKIWSLRKNSIPRAGVYGAVFWFFFTRLSYSGTIRRLARSLSRKLSFVAQSVRRGGGSGEEIQITDHMANVILRKYSESNRRLERILGRNLQSLGYFR
jgi:hypothetical protein